jgi:hypothetical protein
MTQITGLTFKAIVVCGESLFALDENGRVWEYMAPSPGVKVMDEVVVQPRSAYWSPLPTIGRIPA